MLALLLIAVACAPKPSVIRGERLVTDFTQEYNGGVGAGAGVARHWVGAGQGWGLGPQTSLVAERAYPGALAWWSAVSWSSHPLRDGTRTFEGGEGGPLSSDALDGQQVLGWGETGLQYTPDRGWNAGPVELRLLMRGTLALGVVQTRLDVPASDGRVRLASTGLLLAPNGDVGIQAVARERWDLRLLIGVAPLLAFDRAELGGGDSGRVTLRSHAALEALVRF